MRRLGLVCLLGLAIGQGIFASGLPPGTNLISYYVSWHTISIAVFGPDGLQTVSTIPKRNLEERVFAFRDELTRPPKPGEEAIREARTRELGKELYDILIAPVEPYIRDASHLVIVPSGVLFFLPFEALVRCPGCEAKSDLLAGEYLIERYSISYLPSPAWVLEGGGEVEYRRALVIPPPRDIPGALREVQAIRSLFPEAVVVEDFSRFKEELAHDGYQLIHISWGCLVVDPGSPWESTFHIDFEKDLSIAEIARAKAELFVFSGSLWRRYEEWDGEEGAGFGAAIEGLLSSGMRSLVLPLWMTDDPATPRLIVGMYRGLFLGLPKADALRQAKLSLLQDPAYRHPFFWAGFVLYGDWKGRAKLEMGKIEYRLYRELLDWKLQPTPEPPKVEVLLTLKRPVEQGDLEALRQLSSELEVLGAYGSFIVLRVPISLLEELAGLEQVRSISEVPETIP